MGPVLTYRFLQRRCRLFRQPFKILSGYPDLLHVELGFPVAITVKLYSNLLPIFTRPEHLFI
jgi:hypothetical protein